MRGCFKYKIPINILSPIHIGSIDTFNANEYLFLGDNVYRINILNFFNSLNNKNKEKFIKRIQDENFSLSDLKYIDVDILKSFSRYSLINRCSDFPVNNNVQVECSIKSQNKLYIPGSSIKGAIRMALLYNSIQFDQIPELIDKVLFNNYHHFINEFFTSSRKDATIFYNILRFLQIEDSSNFNNTPHLHQVESWYADKDREFMFRKKYETRYLETIPESNTLQTVISTNYDKYFYHELNFNKDTEKLLNLDVISESLFSFADDLINFEIEFFSKLKKYDLVKFYKEKLMENNYYNKPLICLGGANGIYTKTIYLKIYEYDKKNNTHYSENFAQLLFERADELLFPKSRKITYSNSKPLGWAQLDFSNYL